MKSSIVILLKRLASPEDNEKEAKRVINQLQEKGFSEYSHKSGTYMIIVPMVGGAQSDAIKVMKIPGISFYIAPDHLREVSDAIEEHEYFKAFVLCVSLYESFGKNILIRHFKTNKLSLNPEKIYKLTMNSVIMLLYTHRIINEGVYSDMIDVYKVRNDLTHEYMSSIISDTFLNDIERKIPKVKRSLEELHQING